MTSIIETKLSLNEIKDMYFNVFKKKPRGKYANDKLYLLNKINKESMKLKNMKESKKDSEAKSKKDSKAKSKKESKAKSKKSKIITETSIKNTLKKSKDSFEFMNPIDIDINLTNDTPAYKTDELNSHKTSFCERYKDVEPLDLNKINLSKIEGSKCNEIKKKNYFDSTKSFKLSYNNEINLCNTKYISEGSFGTVYLYSDKDEKYKIAVKSYFDSDDDEIGIYKLLLHKGVNCNIINMKIIEYRPFFSKYYVGVMDYMHGSLSDLKGKLDSDLLLPIIKDIAMALDCLKSKKLAYTDLKTDNILYKCSKGKIKIVLGDIGSICRSGDYNSCTWLPIEYLKTGGFPKCNEATMVWGLGVIILELLKFNVNFFHYSNIEKFKETDIKKSHIYIYHKYYIPIKEKYKDYFKFKPNTLTIEDIIFSIFSKTKKRLKLRDIINAIE